jgi:FixJ family two-component response regulator
MASERLPVVAVVDDDDEVRLATVRLLTSAGYAAISYASGAQFVQDMDQRPLACVVLDLHMPVLNGFDVHQQLAARAPALPVVVITGRDTAEARQHSLRLGARAYLPKPVDGEALLQAIEAALNPSAINSGRRPEATGSD